MGLSRERDCGPVGDPQRGQCGGCLSACHPRGCAHRASVPVSLTKTAARTLLTPARVKGEKPASYKTLPSRCLISTTPWGPTPPPCDQSQPTSHPLPAATSACPQLCPAQGPALPGTKAFLASTATE